MFVSAASREVSGIWGSLTAYGDSGFSRFIRRAFLASAGYDDVDLERPIIGVASTDSEFTTCHRDMPGLIAAIKRGVLEEGGLPLVFPTSSLGEILTSPTTMLYRNLLAMETEENIRSLPIDGIVLVGGCDKTVPAQLMGAISADRPALMAVVGPMRTGEWTGERLGACTDCRRYWADYRAGVISEAVLGEIESRLCVSAGTCPVMGTASTMACLTEALGLMVAGGACAPAGSGDRLRSGVCTGREIVRMVGRGVTPRKILSKEAFRNGLAVLCALGGSTNAVIHVIAIARRAGVELGLQEVEAVAREVPLLVNCKPTGTGYMEDFHNAGGVAALLEELRERLDGDAQRYDGQTTGGILGRIDRNRNAGGVIRRLESPVYPAPTLAVLRGTLAPDGAVIKVSAASKALLKHRGQARVFDYSPDLQKEIDRRGAEISADDILVLRNAGPIGAGMPEAGLLPIPKALGERGVKDMVRVSDARMSGTGFGTVVLHCSPEGAVGGPLGLVRDGDWIELDVDKRRLDLCVTAQELRERRQDFIMGPAPMRGWRRLFHDHVMPAHLGMDLDVLGESWEVGPDGHTGCGGVQEKAAARRPGQWDVQERRWRQRV